MYNSITNSHIDNATLAHLGIGNIVLDTHNTVLLLIAVALFCLAFAIFHYIGYKRDKENIPSLRKIEAKIDFYSIDLIRLNNRLKDLENKEYNIEALRKSISELKSLIQRRKNV